MRALVVAVVDLPDDESIENYMFNYEVYRESDGLTADDYGLKLKPLPKEMEEEGYDYDEYRCGWNACLHEILREEE